MVLADFTNDTGEPVFDVTLREALAAQLEQSPFLKVMDDAAVRQSLRLMGRAAGERVTNEVAREVCVREREKAMIDGSIASLGNRTRSFSAPPVASMARRSPGSRWRRQTRNTCSRALGAAASAMRSRLGESLAFRPAAGAPPGDGGDDALTGRVPGVRARNRSLSPGPDAAADSVFSARRGAGSEFRDGLAVARQRVRECWASGRSSVEYSKRAFALIDRVSERERLAISAIYHMRVSGDVHEADAALQLFVQTFPRASIPRSYRGSFYLSIGEFEKSASDFEEMVRLDPRGCLPHMNLAEAYMRLGQFDRATAVSKAARAKGLDAPGFHELDLAVALMQGDDAAAAGKSNGSRDERTSTSAWTSRRRGPLSWVNAGVRPSCCTPRHFRPGSESSRNPQRH